MGKVLFPKLFPSCPADGDPYILSDYVSVVVSDLSATMKQYWRPKKIKLSGGYSKFSEDTRLCTEPANYELVIKSPYGEEKEMVCAARSWVVDSSINVDDPDLSFYWDSQPYYYKEPSDLFTFNSFRLTLTGSNTGGSPCNFGVYLGQIYSIESNGGPYAYTQINICGVPYKMATYSDPATGTGYVSANVEIVEWWSYGGTYNTSTGEKL